MRNPFLIFFSLIVSSIYGQHDLQLNQVFREADSIKIISHLYDYVETPSGELQLESLFTKENEINYKNIKEQHILNNNQIDLLYIILTQPAGDYESVYCFVPHHSILIYKQSNISVIDICFGCRNYSVSENIKTLSPILCSFNTYNQLLDFFKSMNMIYEIPKSGKYGY